MMNTEQIIKALEYCTGIKKIDACADCPAHLGCGDCVDMLREESLALINEQQAEIETLRVENETLKITTIDQYSHLCDCHDKIAEMLRQKEADTVKKMQDELKKTFSALCKGEMDDLYRIIDLIAKEILEGSNEVQE